MIAGGCMTDDDARVWRRCTSDQCAEPGCPLRLRQHRSGRNYAWHPWNSAGPTWRTTSRRGCEPL